MSSNVSGEQIGDIIQNFTQMTEDVNLLDNQGKTALIRASQDGNIADVRALLDNPTIDVNLRGNQGKTALMHAAERRNIDVVRALLDYPTIEVNLIDNNGHFALSYAVKIDYNMDDSNQLDTIKALLDNQKVDANLMIEETMTVLLYAVKKNGSNKYLRVIKVLLDCDKVNVNMKEREIINDGNGIENRTPLIYAVLQTCPYGALALLEHPKIDVNIQDRVAKTALIYAIFSGSPQSVLIALLNHPKINVNIQDNTGKTALIYAVRRLNIPVVEKLLTMPNVPTVITQPTAHEGKEGQHQQVRHLAERPWLNMELQDNDGHSALWYATRPPNSPRKEHIRNLLQMRINELNNKYKKK